MSESSQTRDLCTHIEDTRGALTFAVVASRMQEPGWPDRYVAPPGAWCEFKTGEKRVTPKQRWVLEELTKRGVGAYVVRHRPGRLVDIEDFSGRVLVARVSWDEFVEVLRGLR